MLDDLRRVARVREQAGARGVVEGNSPAALNARLERAAGVRRHGDDPTAPPTRSGPRI